MKACSHGAASDAFGQELGRRLRTLRHARRMSQKTLAEAMGVSFQQVQKYENGSSRITADRLFQVAQLMNTRIDYFYGQEQAASSNLSPSHSGGMHKITLCIAGEVMNIPDTEVRKSLYRLIRTIGKAIRLRWPRHEHGHLPAVKS